MLHRMTQGFTIDVKTRMWQLWYPECTEQLVVRAWCQRLLDLALVSSFVEAFGDAVINLSNVATREADWSRNAFSNEVRRLSLTCAMSFSSLPNFFSLSPACNSICNLMAAKSDSTAVIRSLCVRNRLAECALGSASDFIGSDCFPAAFQLFQGLLAVFVFVVLAATDWAHGSLR